ncbi:MAG: SLBB domain-containing protein [Balneola sp.]
MTLNRISLTVFCMLVFVASAMNSYAQNNPSNSSTSQGSLLSPYFVDEAGLQIALGTTPMDDFIDPESYLLGPFDIITIYGSGNTEFTYRALTINATGDIVVPVVGKISLRGLTLAEAKKTLQGTFNESFRNVQLEVTLDRLRPVNVYIGGNIPNPGHYVVPAGTRFDALVTGFPINEELVLPLYDTELQEAVKASAARPSFSGLNFDRISAETNINAEKANSIYNRLSETYDFRLLKVTSKDGIEKFVDLSGYFNSGNKNFAPYISDGDRVTLIEHSQNRQKVGISGAVNSPFSGSYRMDDTVPTLLEAAGGFSPEADSSSIRVLRSLNGSSEKQILSMEEAVSFKVLPGDQFIVSYTEAEQNFGTVSIEGEVNLPGIFSITPGATTLETLIQQAEGFTKNALPNAAYLIRRSLDNRGVASVSSISMNSLTRGSDQFLEGFDYMQLEQALDPNKMNLDMSRSSVIERTVLMNGDRIFIPKDENMISLLGQVNEPGFYTFNTSLSASDYISLASGTTIAADEDRIFVIKAGSKAWYKPDETTVQSGDIIFVDRDPFEDVSTGRNYEVQIQQLRNTRTQLIITGIGTISSLVTAYVAIRRLN